MIFPLPSGMLDPCQPSSNNWKLSEISFNTRLLDFIIKKTFHFFKIFIYLSFPCWLVLIWTMPETWCYEHFLCLFASSRLIALCIPQLYIALDKSVWKMTNCKCKPGLDHSSIINMLRKKKNITMVHLETKQMHRYILGSVSASLFQLKQLRVTF